MTHSSVERALQIAQENGYKLPDMQEAYRGELLFGVPWYFHSLNDPTFWQALGKGLGWEDHTKQVEIHNRCWRCRWKYFIDHLAEGKDAESFFSKILNQ